METAEHELLRSLGMEVHTIWEGYTIGWPRISVHCDFRSPARFGDLVDIHLWVERRGATSVGYRFRLETTGRLLAEGAVAAVCCRLDDPAGLRPVPIPAPLAAGIDRLLAAGQR
jgi:acyl-CoA thioesterase FadM